MEEVLAQLLTAQNEIEPQFKNYRLAMGALKTAVLSHAIHQLQDLSPAERDPFVAGLQAIASTTSSRQRQAWLNRLEMGRFHRLLPADVAQRAVLTQLNLAGFKQAYDEARLVTNKHIYEQLHQLLSS